MKTIRIPLQVELEVILRLLPLSNASAMLVATSKNYLGLWYLLQTLVECIVYVVLCCERPRSVSERIVHTVRVRGGFEVCLWRFCCRGESILARRLQSSLFVLLPGRALN